MVTRSVRTDIPGRSTPCVDEPASRNSIHAPRGSPVMHLEDQAPLLRGCPDRGGERPAKGGAHTLRSNVWGDARKARRVPRQIRTWSLRRNSRCASTHGVDSRRHLVEQAPLLRGCPDRGGERPAKGGAHALHSNVWGDARKARRVPRRIRTWSLRRKSRCASIHGVDSRRHLADQAPLLRGCPDRGGERPAREGPTRCAATCGATRRARRVPRQIKKKGCLSAALFLYLAERGGLSGASMHPPLPRYALQGQPTAVRFCSCRTVEPRRGFSSPRIRGVDHYNNRLHPPNVGQEKSRPVGGFFLCLAERGGFEPPRRYKRLPDFESGTFNHSATSPGGPRRTGDAHHTRKRGRRQVIPVNEVKIS